MKIEKMLESHLDECAKIYVETFNSEPWNDKWDQATAYKRLADIYNAPGFYGLVAFDGKEMKAAVLGNLEQWYEGYMYSLKEMFVKQGHKGSGLGSKLMNELEDSIKEIGANSIVLFTSKGDQTEKFYTKNGLTTDQDMIMMHKKI